MTDAAPAPAVPPAWLELALDSRDVAAFLKAPALQRLRGGRTRSTPLQLTWYDSPDAALAADGLALCERQLGREASWRIERMRSAGPAVWLPGTPPPVVAEAGQRQLLRRNLPAPLLAVAAFSGHQRQLALAAADDPITVTLLQGALRAVAGERAVCRVLLSGPGEALQALALSLAADLRLSVPAASLAAQAYGVSGRSVPPRALGPPVLQVDVDVGHAFAQATGHLACVMLHWAPAAAAGEAPEPVHQMRVALRRLRSALKVFRRAVGCPDLDAVEAELRSLSRVLGAARDWDVFGLGTGRAVAKAFPDDRAVTRLLAAAERRRKEGYAALQAHLAAPSFRALGVRLACAVVLRPWEREAADDANAADRAAERARPLADFAAQVLARRLAHLVKPGGDLNGLPPDELHAVRIQAKRLRYAAEIFLPLFPPRTTHRFIRRVAALQEQLGHLNDAAVAARLMADLGSAGADRRYAMGVVRGFVAASAQDQRGELKRSWKKLRRAPPFWS